MQSRINILLDVHEEIIKLKHSNQNDKESIEKFFILKILNLDANASRTESIQAYNDLGEAISSELKSSEVPKQTLEKVNSAYAYVANYLRDDRHFNYSSKHITDIANQAIEYARKKLPFGSNRPENSSDDNQKFSGVETDIYLLIDEKIKEEKKRLSSNDQRLLNTILIFEYGLEITAEHQFGNCGYLAMHALNFILMNTDLSAELFCNLSGDHTFVVLNRDPDTEISNFSSWNEDVLLCDPWFDATFQKSDLLKYQHSSNLKEQMIYSYFITDKYYQATNTDELKLFRSSPSSIENFLIAFKKIESVLQQNKEKLEEQKIKLIEKYGDTDPKVVVINKQINKINIIMLDINMDASQLGYVNDYRLKILLENMINNAETSTKFMGDDKIAITESRPLHTKNFFSFVPSTQSILKALKEETHQQLATIRSEYETATKTQSLQP